MIRFETPWRRTGARVWPRIPTTNPPHHSDRSRSTSGAVHLSRSVTRLASLCSSIIACAPTRSRCRSRATMTGCSSASAPTSMWASRRPTSTPPRSDRLCRRTRHSSTTRMVLSLRRKGRTSTCLTTHQRVRSTIATNDEERGATSDEAKTEEQEARRRVQRGIRTCTRCTIRPMYTSATCRVLPPEHPAPTAPATRDTTPPRYTRCTPSTVDKYEPTYSGIHSAYIHGLSVSLERLGLSLFDAGAAREHARELSKTCICLTPLIIQHGHACRLSSYLSSSFSLLLSCVALTPCRADGARARRRNKSLLRVESGGGGRPRGEARRGPEDRRHSAAADAHTTHTPDTTIHHHTREKYRPSLHLLTRTSHRAHSGECECRVHRCLLSVSRGDARRSRNCRPIRADPTQPQLCAQTHCAADRDTTQTTHS